MKEVEFNQKKKLEKNIENLTTYFEELPTLDISVVVAIGVFIGSFVLEPFQAIELVNKAFLSIATGVTTALSVEAYNIVGTALSKLIRKKAKKNLNEVKKTLSENDIKTSVKELTRSVVLENEIKTSKEINDDGKRNSEEAIIKEKYHLFLDEEGKTQGILERKCSSTIDGFEEQVNKYYILEEEDIKMIEPKVEKVKRLVKVKK